MAYTATATTTAGRFEDGVIVLDLRLPKATRGNVDVAVDVA